MDYESNDASMFKRKGKHGQQPISTWPTSYNIQQFACTYIHTIHVWEAEGREKVTYKLKIKTNIKV